MSDDENYNYFELKYLEEINDLFLEFKNENNFYNLKLFTQNNNFMDLFNFLYDSIELIDEESDNEDINTFNDEENYSML